MPFLIAVSAVTLLLIFVPEVVLIVPDLIFGKDMLVAERQIGSQTKMGNHWIEIAIIVKQAIAAHDAECCNDQIDGLANRYARLT